MVGVCSCVCLCVCVCVCVDSMLQMQLGCLERIGKAWKADRLEIGRSFAFPYLTSCTGGWEIGGGDRGGGATEER